MADSSDKQRVSVVTPIGQAWERMVRVCFKPFDIVKWMCIGFSLFLADLWATLWQFVQQGLQVIPPNMMVPMPQPGQGPAAYFQQHGPTIAAAVGVVFVIVLVLYGITTFFSSRGSFMFLDGLIHNRPDIKLPWNHYAEPANQVFIFKVLVTLACWLINFATAGVVWWVVWPDIVAGVPGDRSMWSLIIALPILTIVWLLYLKGMVITGDFVVPMMIAQPMSVWRAWWVWLSEFLKRYVWAIILFYLLRALFVMAIGSIGMLVCCFTFFVGAMPYIQSVVLLPALAFDRLYSAYFVEQFGPRWLLLPREDAEALICPGCRYDLRGNPAATSCPECGYDLTAVPRGAADV